MKNILTDKCWKVQIAGWQDNQGAGLSHYAVAQTIECSGLEVVGILADRELQADGETKVYITSLRRNGPSVDYMLQCAKAAVDRAIRVHEWS
jgi:hypothetical protein